MKIIMTITDAVQGHRDLDALEIAVVFKTILHDSHINEGDSDLGNVMIHSKSYACLKTAYCYL